MSTSTNNLALAITMESSEGSEDYGLRPGSGEDYALSEQEEIEEGTEDSGALSFGSDTAPKSEGLDSVAQGNLSHFASAVVIDESEEMIMDSNRFMTIDGVTARVEDVQEMLDTKEDLAEFFSNLGLGDAFASSSKDTWAPEGSTGMQLAAQDCTSKADSKLRARGCLKGTFKQVLELHSVGDSTVAVRLGNDRVASHSAMVSGPWSEDYDERTKEFNNMFNKLKLVHAEPEERERNITSSEDDEELVMRLEEAITQLDLLEFENKDFQKKAGRADKVGMKILCEGRYLTHPCITRDDKHYYDAIVALQASKREVVYEVASLEKELFELREEMDCKMNLLAIQIGRKTSQLRIAQQLTEDGMPLVQDATLQDTREHFLWFQERPDERWLTGEIPWGYMSWLECNEEFPSLEKNKCSPTKGKDLHHCKCTQVSMNVPLHGNQPVNILCAAVGTRSGRGGGRGGAGRGGTGGRGRGAQAPPPAGPVNQVDNDPPLVPIPNMLPAPVPGVGEAPVNPAQGAGGQPGQEPPGANAPQGGSIPIPDGDNVGAAPMPVAPAAVQGQGPGESDAAYAARVERYRGDYAHYGVQLRAFKDRQEILKSSQVGTPHHLHRAIANITNLKPDGPVSISEWLRSTRANLLLRGVENETKQVQLASSFLQGALNTRWVLASELARKAGTVITWQLFCNELLTSSEGKQPAEKAREDYDNFTYGSGTASENIHRFTRIMDTLNERAPGTKVACPGGYDVCNTFMTKIVANLPVTVRIAIQSSYQQILMLKEREQFFQNATGTQLQRFYGETLKTIVAQAKELVKQLPNKDPAAGTAGKDKKDKGQEKSKPLDKNGKFEQGKRTREEKGKAGPSKRDRPGKSYGGMIDKIKESGVDITKLYQVKGKCLYCGRDNHSAKDCTANLSANPAAQKARDVGKAYFNSQ